MKKSFQHPVFLLLVTGALIGLNFPLGKIAAEAGVSPVLWSFLISASAAIAVLPPVLLRNPLKMREYSVWRYASVAALVTFVGANLLVFAAIPHVGAGYTSLMFAVSPVFTLGLSALFGLRLPGRIGVSGIVVALIGAATVALTRQSVAFAAPALWIGLAFLIPIALALGNVYRTIAWPKNASPDHLACATHFAAAVMFVAIMLAAYGDVPIGQLAEVPMTSIAQAVVAGLTFPVYYRLQRAGGPVMLSQIGYVAATVSLLSATLLLGEIYAPLTWAGAAVIAVGIGLTIADYRRPAQPN